MENAIIYKPSKRNEYIIRAIMNKTVIAIYGKANRLIDAEVIFGKKQINDPWVVIYPDGTVKEFATSDECQSEIESNYYTIGD